MKGNKYIINDNYVEMIIESKVYGIIRVKIDNDDLEKCSQLTWHYAKNKDSKYIQTRIKGKMIKLHRYIMNINNSNLVVDHINRNPLDNRKSNLRICSYQENSFNKSIRVDNTSGIPGVSFHKINKKWRAKIKYNNLLNKKSKLDSITKKKLYFDSIGLVFQKIGGILSTSFDTIIISMFLGLSEVTIYSNYNFVAKSIGAFLDLSFEAIIASIGNSLVEESHCKNINDFNDLSFLNFWLTGWAAISLSCLIQNFEWKWTAGSIMASDSVAILLAVCFYFSYIRKIVLTYKDALGLWSEDKFKPIVGGIFNLIVNIILVNKIGIQGVIISTILSYILIEIPWENIILLKKHYKIDMRNYYLSSFYMIFCTVIAWSITYYICSFFGYEWISFFIKIIICLIVPNLIIFIMNYKRKSIKAIERLVKIILKVKRIAAEVKS